MKRIVLYHPDQALVGMETAENLGLSDYAFASRLIPSDEIWITSDPDVVAQYEALLESQRGITQAMESQ